MCGVALAAGLDRVASKEVVSAMTRAMIARGPDDEGIAMFEGDRYCIALGSRRLAIIDRSPLGHQPMQDETRNTTIVYNGMLYNFRELRRRLERAGERFRSDCDTEVVLRAYGVWGTECVREFSGMFAFAIWDERSGSLFLARDYLGIKPLYYHYDRGTLLAASQLKALLASKRVPLRLSSAGVASFLRFGAVSDPLSAVDRVFALPAGHTATFANGKLVIERFRTLEDGDAIADADHDLRDVLDDAVSRHLVSDAPLGIFLSGGLDSSLLAAVAARHTDELRTMCVVFDEEEFSEGEYARLVARHVGAEHVEVALSSSDLHRLLPEAFRAMDQPTFDGINTFVVSHAAHEIGLKVALSGLGADELFSAYGNARRVRMLARARRLPATVARAAAPVVGLAMRRRGAKAAQWLREGESDASAYRLIRELFSKREVESLTYGARTEYANGLPPSEGNGDLFNAVSRLELATYMRNVLLRDTDAMSMAQSLEVRVPYLHDALVDRVLSIPGTEKEREIKGLLARIAEPLLPRVVLERQKQGFLLPLATWLHAELAPEIDRTLAVPPAAVGDVLDLEELAGPWEDFRVSGRRWLRPWSLFALCRWTETAAEVAAQ